MNSTIGRSYTLAITSLIALGWVASEVLGVTVLNPGFEDVSGQSVFNEFTFGEPAGWDLYDTNNVIPDAGTFVGTLEPNGAGRNQSVHSFQ